MLFLFRSRQGDARDHYDDDDDVDDDVGDNYDDDDDDAHDDYEDGCKEMPGEPIRDLQSVLTQPTNIGAMATRSFCKREKYTFNFLRKQEENLLKKKGNMLCKLCSLNRLTSGPWPPDHFARERNILLTF